MVLSLFSSRILLATRGDNWQEELWTNGIWSTAFLFYINSAKRRRATYYTKYMNWAERYRMECLDVIFWSGIELSYRVHYYSSYVTSLSRSWFCWETRSEWLTLGHTRFVIGPLTSMTVNFFFQLAVLFSSTQLSDYLAMNRWWRWSINRSSIHSLPRNINWVLLCLTVRSINLLKTKTKTEENFLHSYPH